MTLRPLRRLLFSYLVMGWLSSRIIHLSYQLELLISSKILKGSGPIGQCTTAVTIGSFLKSILFLNSIPNISPAICYVIYLKVHRNTLTLTGVFFFFFS